MRRGARQAIGFGLVAIAVAACTGTGSPVPSPTASVSAQPAPSASAPATSSIPSASPVVTATKGPASWQFALTGTAGLTGPVSGQTILCDRPSLDGPEIFFLGQAGTTGPQIVIFVRAGYVEVRVGSGSGATLQERDFTGTSVTAFDAATGAQLDTALTETTAAGGATGDLGALARITGTIDCGDQQPGSANIVISGLSPYGQLDGAITGVEVRCTVNSGASYVSVSGLSTAGTMPVLVFVTASAATLLATIETRTTATTYLGKGAQLTTLVTGGASMAGDVIEQVAATATPSPSRLHVAGDATCGTP